jgi:hypothetical protein
MALCGELDLEEAIRGVVKTDIVITGFYLIMSIVHCAEP